MQRRRLVTQTEQEQAKCLEFFKRLDFKKARLALKKAEELAADPFLNDSVYRIFHHSFKMYPRFQQHAYLFLTYMLEPIYHHLSFVHKTKELSGEHIFDQIIYELDYWYASPLLLTFVRNLRDTKFTFERNSDEHWFEDTRNLVAGVFMCQSVCLSTLRSLVAMGEKQGFIWAKKPAVLGYDDAMFLEAWKIHGSVFRYGVVKEGREETETEVMKMLREKLKLGD